MWWWRAFSPCFWMRTSASTVHRFLESESNQTDREDKFNRVDMLAEDSSGRLIIIEMQNEQEYDYFHRMLYGTSA